MGNVPSRKRLIADLQFLQCEDLEIWCIGGSVRACLTGERYNDNDLVFVDEKTYHEFERRMLARDDVECSYHPRLMVVRKSDGHWYDPLDWAYGPIQYHIDYNDWMHTATACDMRGNFILDPRTVQSIETKTLMPGKSMHALDFQLRHMYRFINEGWSYDDNLFHTMARKIHDATTFEWSDKPGRRGSMQSPPINPKRIA
jgi:hypothetical protein